MQFLSSPRLRTAALALALTAVGAYAAVHWFLPWLLPFLIAASAAALLEPAVACLCRRGCVRGAASGICVMGALALLVLLVWLLGGRLAHECMELLPRLPGMLSAFLDTLRTWQMALERGIPDGLAHWTEQAVSGAADALADLPSQAASRLPRLLSALAAAAPEALLFTVTTVIGAYFISASYPELQSCAARLLPERFQMWSRPLWRSLRQMLGRWLRAQGLLSLITCAVLAVAFLLLRVRYALLLALLTALIDALPVLGTGTVLLPWAVYDLLTGNVPRFVGLLVTYAAATVLRSCIQAKLLGDQLGLHPLASLMSIYAGWKLCGVWGMLLFPLLAVCLKQGVSVFLAAQHDE